MNIAHMSFEHGFSSVKERIHNHSQKVTASLEVSKPKNHLRVLDGVRAIACLAVLLYHTNLLALVYGIWKPIGGIKNFVVAPLVYFGESGVILFFLLSGFLLFLPFAKVLVFGGQWPSIPRFYLRRIFRIVPGYFVALFLLILFFHSEFLHSAQRGQLWEFLTFRMSNDLSQRLNGPFWTLAVEFQFYMLLPLIAWIFSLVVRRSTVRGRMAKLTSCLLVMLAWGLLSRYWGLSITGTAVSQFPQSIFIMLKPFIYGDTGKFFEAFAVGMLIAMIYIYTQNAPNGEFWRVKFQHRNLWIFLAGLALLGFLSLLHFCYIETNLAPPSEYYSILPFLDPYMKIFIQIWLQWEAIGYAIAYGLCIFALLYGASQLKRIFEWSLLRWIGLISFSLYMWHLPLLFLYMNAILPHLQGEGKTIKLLVLWVWIIFIIFPISLTLYRWIEMPGMRLGEILIQEVGKLRRRVPRETPGNTPAPEQALVETAPIKAVSLPESADIS